MAAADELHLAERAAGRAAPAAWAAHARAAAGSAALAAPVLALASVLVQGFCYGFVNNVFQLPIALGMTGWPQFRDDWFYQSLGSYTSAVWPLLARTGGRLATPAAFFCLHVVTRAAILASLWLLLKRLGVAAAERWLVGLLLIVSPLLLVGTAVGQQTIFDNNFNQDGIAWTFVALAWLLYSGGRFGAAVATTGPCFAVSSFTAVWTSGALTFAGAAEIVGAPRPERIRRLRDIVLKGAAGAAAALLVAAPALVWTARALVERPHAPFDYAAFLWSYFPHHFFIAASTPGEIAGLGALAAAGAIGLARLGRPALPLLRLHGGYVVLFLVGAALPYVTHARVALNLHLLRVDGCLVLIAALVGAAVGLSDLVRGRTIAIRACGALALFAILPNPGVAFLLPIALMAPLLLQRRAPVDQPAAAEPARWARLASALVVVAVLGAAGATASYQVDATHRLFAEQQRLGGWFRSNTPVMSKILIRRAVRPGFDLVQFLAQRQVWVDWKRGAAVMWRPDVYGVWRQRMDETAALKTADAAAAYACGHGIRYLIEDPAALRQSHPGRTLYDDGYAAVVDLEGACPSAPAARVS